MTNPDGGSESASPLVVVDEEFEPVALVERTLVRDRIHQNERLRPTYVALEIRVFTFLSAIKIHS